MQFVIFLSALLASLTGLVAGERQPVRAQVEMSAVSAAVTAEKATAVAQSGIAQPITARPAAQPVQVLRQSRVAIPVAPARMRLALKQSWLF